MLIKIFIKMFINVNLFAVDFNVRDIILENGGDVHFWELIFAEDY